MEARTLDCAIEAPDAYVPRARYALEMLLMPLGITPRWVSGSRLEAGDPGIYYGTGDPPTSSRTLVIELQSSTITYFRRGTSYPAAESSWIEVDGHRVPKLFPLNGRGFDPIASAFFWLSGWQECTTRMRDRHGRFPYEASLQSEWNLNDQPSVDVYRRWLKQHLRSHEVMVEHRRWGKASWAVCPTHDIDYLRKWRPGIVYRELVEYLLRNRLRQPLAERLDRMQRVITTARRGSDPYRDSWERMQGEESRRNVGATYFLKTGAHSPYDVEDGFSRGYLRERAAELAEEGFEIGLHPSYHAATHGGYMARELKDLRELTGRSVRSVRQHYLRYVHPLTARIQTDLGFMIDSSMGFAAREGFRNGTCLPFRYYDILEDRVLPIWSFPLAVMDSTLFGYRELTHEGAFERTLQLLDTCREFGGVCVALWHNIIYDPVDGHGYGNHFEAVLDEACRRGAFVGSLGAALDGWGNDAPF